MNNTFNRLATKLWKVKNTVVGSNKRFQFTLLRQYICIIDIQEYTL